ncbi:caspase family protein [Duganella fentianensis]|uniref:caspase family protein n=1 Tax=Duganella fentianensis TaxID=2692177 RepID=UPI0032B270B8
MKRCATLVLWLWCCALAQAQAAPAVAPDKLALVIGNGSYSGGLLPNTRADADLVATALRRAGFKVTLAKDLARTAMYDKVNQFVTSLTPGATALVYYAGHGMQIDGVNYLVPVDMVPTSAAGVGMRAFPLTALSERLALGASAVNLIVLDACRNNPFQPVPAVRMRAYADLGLRTTRAPRGTLIAYSTAPGQLAEDGSGRAHSIYSETLAALIDQPGLPVDQLFRTLADQVRQRTREDQQPWFESSLVGQVYFRPPAGWQYSAAAAPLAAAAPSASPRYRSGPGSIGSEGQAAWYRHLDERGWTELDNDLQQRAARVDAGELATLKRRAAQGNVVAQTTLGLNELACPGAQTRSCARRALAWFRQAAELGFPVAQTELGEAYYQGRLLPRDLKAARHWLETAAQASYPRARIDLAQLTLEQDGSPAAARELIETLLKSSRSMLVPLAQPGQTERPK